MTTEPPSSAAPASTSAPTDAPQTPSLALTAPESKADKSSDPPDSAPPAAAAADSGAGESPPPPQPPPPPRVDSSASSHAKLPATTSAPPSASASASASASTSSTELPKSSSPKSLTISIPVATTPGLFSYPGATVAGGDGRSFSQLLAGAMASPLANRPGTPVLAVPMVAVPCFLAPASLLDSCGITGQFAMSHQAVLATVTAQAQMQLQAGFSSPTHHLNQLPLSPMPLQQKSPHKSEGNNSFPGTTNEKQKHGVDIVVKSISSDGYNWRKYGQKQVKSSDSSRSYYRCTQANCPAKKKVERTSDGRVTEVVYQGEHNHEPPQKGKHGKEKENQSGGVPRDYEKPGVKNVNSNQAETSSKEEKGLVNMTAEQLHCSSDCEDDGGSKTEDHKEPDPKKLCTSPTPMTPMTPLFRTVREQQKVIIEKGCDAGLPTDGFRWRKYGQKIVKGNPNPRSYYKCTHMGCPVRKHVERHSEDAKTVIITYEGNHIHDSPYYRVGSESPAASVRIGASAAVPSEGKKLETSSALDQKPPLESQYRNDTECPDDKAIVLAEAMEGSKEPKSMEIQLSPTVPSVDAPEFVNQPNFDESKAIVAVKNT